MIDTDNTPVPQNFDILIYAGVINIAHPEQSTLTLKLRGPYPATDESTTTDPAQHEQGELKPGDDIGVKPGDKVTWIIMESAISSILVMDDNKNKNVFESGPAPVSGTTNWSGIIDKKIVGRKEETYAICWSQGGLTYCYDPKITVNL